MMIKWTQVTLLLVNMTAGLAFIGLVGALTIDNQLTVIKNDCFERLAIGQRLNPKDIYTTIELNTVPDCQRECTKDGDRCKTFSFGIGLKGNASCELSAKVVRETVDLKPIGTDSDTDFDLYIKKLGCKLVIEQPLGSSLIPIEADEQHVSPSGYGQENKPTQSSPETFTLYNSQDDSYGSGSDNYRPTNLDKHKPEPVFKPENGYSTTRPRYGSGNKQQVETTLISIRPDPNRPSYTGLGPAIGFHDPNRPDPGRPNSRPERPTMEYGPGYGYGNSRPTSRPYNSRPYGNEFNGRPVRPYNDDRPNDYGRPSRPRPSFYDRPYDNLRPVTFGPQHYDTDRYDKPRPSRPYDRPGYLDEDDSRPPFRPSSLNRPYNDKPYFRPGTGSYDPGPNKFRPSDDSGYSNEIPNPDFDRLRPDLDRPRPSMDRPRPELDRPRPDDGYDRPRPEFNRPRPELDRPRPELDRPRPDDGYDRPNFDRPRPNLERPRPELDRPRPDIGYDRPLNDPIDRPRPSLDRPRPEFDRPRPDLGYDRPLMDSIDRPRPNLNRPRPDLDRPRPEFDRPRPDMGYNRPLMDDIDRPKPNYNGDKGDRFHFEYDRPNLEKPIALNRPSPNYNRPSDYERPNKYDRPDYDRPSDRPVKYDRPDNIRPSDGYDQDYYRPDGTLRPTYNSRPNNFDGYGGRPEMDRPRPHIRPDIDLPPIDRPHRPRPNNNRPDYDRPRPISDYESYSERPRPVLDRPTFAQGYDDNSLLSRPINNNNLRPYDPNNPNVHLDEVKPVSEVTSYNNNIRRGDNIKDGIRYVNGNRSVINIIDNTTKHDEKSKPIITQTIGPHGETITSIITEIKSSK